MNRNMNNHEAPDHTGASPAIIPANPTVQKEDDIAAISTPSGSGGIAVVRLSGPDSWSIAAKIFSPLKSGDIKSHLLRLGDLLDPDTGRSIDRILCAYMKGPKTYTGEDLVEFHTHGGILAAGRVLEVCLKQGARMAEPGEFTRRAFFSGRIDLSQAEAVAELISARSLAEADLASAQLRGGLKLEIEDLRSILIEILAQLEVALDFPDEELEIIDGYSAAETIRDRVLNPIDRLLSDYRTGRVFREGVRIAIVGRPNVGKSSLFNRLTGRDAAIVTDLPGTTRDALESAASFYGLPATLIDTAGLESPPKDKVEAEGQRRSALRLTEADLALLVFDGSKSLGPEDVRIAQLCPQGKTIYVINKIDLPSSGCDLEGLFEIDLAQACRVSALKKTGLDVLHKKIFLTLTGSEDTATRPPELVISLRHKKALEEARPAVIRAADLLESIGPLELAALEINCCLEALGRIIGATTPDDVLDEVFSRFCLGK